MHDEAAGRDADPALTILVPTRNEAPNVEPLLERLSAALAQSAVVLFVDDSDDETPRVVQSAAVRGYPGLDVRLLHRSRTDRTGGLGGAVLAGVSQTTTPWVCVMDGDLQHPPECVPKLVEAAVEHDAQLVVGSRYVPGGGNEGLGAVRSAVSLASTVLAKAVFPYRLRGIHDPMSGFFLLRRDALTESMTPRGFKILLEIAARHPGLSRREVPFVFVERTAGTSKVSLAEGYRFLLLLGEMRWRLRSRKDRGRPDLPAVSSSRATARA
jgi:dolichol-phosphate mannosyltransferase